MISKKLLQVVENLEKTIRISQTEIREMCETMGIPMTEYSEENYNLSPMGPWIGFGMTSKDLNTLRANGVKRPILYFPSMPTRMETVAGFVRVSYDNQKQRLYVDTSLDYFPLRDRNENPGHQRHLEFMSTLAKQFLKEFANVRLPKILRLPWCVDIPMEQWTETGMWGVMDRHDWLCLPRETKIRAK